MVVAIQVANDEIIAVESDGKVESFRWCSVEEIAVFKRDFGIFDDIRLAFRVADDWVEISEDIKGWAALTEMMVKQIPGIPASWYFDVMLPPFETNFRILYKRETATQP